LDERRRQRRPSDDDPRDHGTFHHLEAIRVIEDEDGRQHAASPEFEEIVDGMFLIGGDGPFDTVSIKGDSYLLVAIPFQ